MAGVLLDERDARELSELVRWWRSQRRGIEQGQQPRGPITLPPIRVILHDDLPVNGQVAASVTEMITTTEVQQIRFRGGVDGGVFSLRWEPGSVDDSSPQTADIAYDASANDVRNALDKLPKLTAADLRVDKASEGHWIVSFGGGYVGQDVPLIQVADDSQLTGGASAVVIAQSYWEDTGRVENVREILGVGTPTPLQRGTVAACLFFMTAGWSVVSAECRDFRWYAS